MRVSAISDADIEHWLGSKSGTDAVLAHVERKTEFRVTMADVRAAKMCSKGARAFFARHDLDWRDFLKNGIAVETLEEINDAMSNKVIEVARGRQQ